MRQGVTNLAGCTDMHITFRINLFFHAILPTMRFVCHHNDVLTV